MQKFKDVLKSVDKFGDSVNFSVKNGLNSYRTWPGAICSLIIYSIILLYGSTKFTIMAKRQDTKQVSTVQEYAFSQDQVFEAEELGFDF